MSLAADIIKELDRAEGCDDFAETINKVDKLKATLPICKSDDFCLLACYAVRNADAFVMPRPLLEQINTAISAWLVANRSSKLAAVHRKLERS